MSARGRVWALLAATYLTTIQTLAVLRTGVPTLALESLVKVVVIPAMQAVVLIGFNRAPDARTSRQRRLSQFFRQWVVLAPTLAVGTAAVELVITRRLLWTDAAFFLLIITSTAQAAALTRPFNGTRHGGLGTLASSPFARAIVLIDVVILILGWTVSADGILGFAGSALLQRRWIAAKFIACACVCALLWRRFASRGKSHRGRASLAGAIVFAALGADALSSWMSAAIAPFDSPAVAFSLRVAIYGVVAAVAITVAMRAGSRLASSSPMVLAAFDAGALALFVTALAAAMNGFLSIQPVHPWAAIAMTASSVAASALLVGAVAALPARRTARTGIE